MTDLPLGIIFGVIGAVITVIFVLFAKRQMDHTNVAWQSAAEMLRFSFKPGTMRSGPTIAGMIEDHPADVYSYTKSSGTCGSTNGERTSSEQAMDIRSLMTKL